jgi:PPP family 3-phenylpropionic acid transporter
MRASVSNAIRLNYLFYAIAGGCTYPYLAPYFKKALQVSDSHLGLIVMIRPLMALVGQPFWSAMADGSGRRSHLAAVLLTAASILSLVLMGAAAPAATVVLFAVWSFFNAPINTLSDGIALDYLGAEGRTRFAGLRVFVSIGFLVAVAFVGFLYDRTDLSWQFAVFSLVALPAIVFLWMIPPVAGTPPRQGLQALRELLRKRNVLIFLAALFLAETANAMGLAFLSVYSQALGANNVQVGWIWGMGTACEIVTMLLFARIYPRLGVRKILLIGCAAVVIKWLPFAHVHVWWQILPLQVMHAFTLTFLYVGSVTFMDMEGHSSIRVTAQAFYTMFILNAANVVGSILAGWISQHHGMPAIYHASSLMGAAALFILVAFVRSPAEEQEEAKAVLQPAGR